MINLQETTIKRMDANSVCLVSGGGKGITAQAAIAIAQQYQCKFILLGRSSISQIEAAWAQDCNSELTLKKRILEHLLEQGTKPTPMMVQKEYKAIAAKREIEQTIREIESAGGKAEYLSVDVTDKTALATKLAVAVEQLGSVTAIIHGAGNLADKPIEKKSESDYDTVYKPKVLGLSNLLSCVDPEQLDYLVLFSSVVGFYGNAGQTDYALANDILNKTAHLVKRYHPHCRVVAIDWGPWDSGMVSPQLKQAFAERGIETIPIEVGTQMLVAELAAPNQDTQLIIGSPLTPTAIAINPQLQKYRIRRRLSVVANPFLLDHVIANRPVLPAACAMSWITNSCEQIYPGYKYFGCQQFKVLKGIVFEDNIPQEYILDLTEITKDRDQIEFEARIWSQNQAGKIRYHFSTQLVLKGKIPDSPQYESLNLTPQPQQIIKNDFYQNGGLSLFHGASFQGVQKILNCNEEKITIQCSLPPVASQVQGQFPVQTFNPYILDVQIHSLWLWSQYLHQQICLPSAIAHYEQYASIAFGETFYVSCEIKSKTDTAVVADVIAHKQNGQIYSQMMGARGTIISLPPG